MWNLTIPRHRRPFSSLFEWIVVVELVAKSGAALGRRDLKEFRTCLFNQSLFVTRAAFGLMAILVGFSPNEFWMYSILKLLFRPSWHRFSIEYASFVLHRYALPMCTNSWTVHTVAVSTTLAALFRMGDMGFGDLLYMTYLTSPPDGPHDHILCLAELIQISTSDRPTQTMRDPEVIMEPVSECLDPFEPILDQYNQLVPGSSRKFPVGSLQTFEQAVDKSIETNRAILVYLNSRCSPETPRFLETFLFSSAFQKFIEKEQPSLVFWGADVSSKQGRKAGEALGATRYPFLALVDQEQINVIDTARTNSISILQDLEFQMSLRVDRAKKRLKEQGLLIGQKRLETITQAICAWNQQAAKQRDSPIQLRFHGLARDIVVPFDLQETTLETMYGCIYQHLGDKAYGKTIKLHNPNDHQGQMDNAGPRELLWNLGIRKGMSLNVWCEEARVQ